MELTPRKVCIKSQILTNFPALMKPQCISEERKQMLPDLEEASVTALQVESGTCPISTVASLLESWLGLGCNVGNYTPL